MISLETGVDTFILDSETGGLVSFRRKATPEIELMMEGTDHPAFVIQYLDENQRFRQLDSHDAGKVIFDEISSNGTVQQLAIHFQEIGGLPLHVTLMVEAGSDQPLSRWTLRLHNDANLRITDLQYPIVVLPYGLGDPHSNNALVWPVAAGRLLQNPQPYDLEPDSPHAWQMRPENSTVLHYPGFVTAQFLAYYNETCGMYLAADDTQGYIKLIKPVHHNGGLRLGISHLGDWPERGERTLEYGIMLGSFAGDWYTAADIYRNWALQQHWAEKPLSQRDDVPDWLLDSPAHLMVRIQGELDHGPAEPNTQFLPYPKLLPLLENVSKQINAPVLPVLMSWERGGPWVYPDCFPPVGADSLADFTAGAREKGWHVGTFSNGTRWVTGHYWSGYDGSDYFEEHEGAQTVCRTHKGELWAEQWDATWRPSYAGCMAVPETQAIAQDYVNRIVDYGLDWIQFLDQNVGAATFPCYSDNHGHSAMPGRWMTDAMLGLTKFFQQKSAEVTAEDNRQLVFSVEGPVNEFLIPSFQICDIRVVPPSHEADNVWWKGSIPLYHFLYHELLLIQGGFGHGADPHHLAIRNAYNLVVGEIPGAVLKGDGRLLNKDNPGINWAPWEPQVGDDAESLAMLRSTLALRRGPGFDYLVLGRMQPPANVETQTIEWQDGRKVHAIPAVFDAAWQDPDGNFAIVLANWTQGQQQVTVTDPRLLPTVQLTIARAMLSTELYDLNGECLTVSLPPLSCALIGNYAKTE